MADGLNAVGPVPIAAKRIERHAVGIGILEEITGAIQGRQDGVLHCAQDVRGRRDLITTAPEGQGGMIADQLDLVGYRYQEKGMIVGIISAGPLIFFFLRIFPTTVTIAGIPEILEY